jgi:tetratricopeptide (TPR) repeat protein
MSVERVPIKYASGFKRLWNAIKPPPAVESQDQSLSPEERLRRRRLVLGTVAVVVVGAAGWGTYQYIASAPMRAEKVYQDGMRLVGAGDFKGAEDRFTSAISIWPRLASAYLQRGLARKSLNHVDAAIDDFQHAITEDSNLAPAHTALGVIYRERGDLTRAMTELTAAINLGNTLSANTDAFYQRGQIYESQGEHQQALQDYDAAIHEEPDAPYVYRARAMTRDAMGDHDDAEQDRREAIRIERH